MMTLFPVLASAYRFLGPDLSSPLPAFGLSLMLDSLIIIYSESAVYSLTWDNCHGKYAGVSLATSLLL